MVKRIFNIINKEINSLHQAAYLLGFFALLAQILALVRDRLFAYTFGASHTLDIYYASFRIPDFLFAVIVPMVSLSVIIPFLAEKISQGKEEGKNFFDSIFSLFIIIIVSVSGITFFLVPYLISWLFPGFSGEAGSNLIIMTRILLLSPILLGISNYFASATQFYKRFFIYALSPVLYNLGIIVGIMFFYPRFGMNGLVIGVILGALAHLSIQLPFIYKIGLIPKFTFNINFSSIKKVLYVSIPRTITLSINEISEMILISIASLMSAGSISIFTFSLNLQSVPISIIGISYAMAAFPILIELHRKGEIEKFVEQMKISAKHIIFWLLPSTVFFIVLKAQIVRVILGAGRFSWSDTRLTAATLSLFVVSVTAQSLVLLFVRSHYARGSTYCPLFINLFSAILVICSAFILTHFFNTSDFFRNFIEALFKVENIKGSSILMLPLAFSIGLIINALIHFINFSKSYKEFSRPIFKVFFQSFCSAIIMGGVIYLGLNFWNQFFNINTLIGIFAQGFFSGIGGIIVGVITLKLLKNEEIEEVWRALHRKIWKTKVIIPEQTSL